MRSSIKIVAPGILPPPSARCPCASRGARDEEIAAVTGHKTTAMLRKHAGAERQKAHAKAGQGKRGTK